MGLALTRLTIRRGDGPEKKKNFPDRGINLSVFLLCILSSFHGFPVILDYFGICLCLHFKSSPKGQI